MPESKEAGKGLLYPTNGKGVPNEVSLGAAGKMRAEASARVLPMLRGFVPGPVSEMLAVSEGPHMPLHNRAGHVFNEKLSLQ